MKRFTFIGASLVTLVVAGFVGHAHAQVLPGQDVPAGATVSAPPASSVFGQLTAQPVAAQTTTYTGNNSASLPAVDGVSPESLSRAQDFVNSLSQGQTGSSRQEGSAQDALDVIRPGAPRIFPTLEKPETGVSGKKKASGSQPTDFLVAPQPDTSNFPSLGTVFRGRPKALDGATLMFADGPVRLTGDLVFPTPDQSCQLGAVKWKCGEDSVEALAFLVRDGVTTCVVTGYNAAGIVEGRCLNGGTNLSSATIAAGMVKSGDVSYLSDTTLAKTAGRGLWAKD